jgi:uncharacterized membrane protein YphA (DoxX/SURF4 family)
VKGIFVLLCRLAVGGIFIYASLDKLTHPQAFAVTINNYHLVPFGLLHLSAHLLPVVELVVGSALVVGLRQRGAALLAGIMTVIFMAAITSALVRNLDISCGCFNTDGGHSVGLDLLWLDVILLSMCLPPLLARDPGFSLDRFFRK